MLCVYRDELNEREALLLHERKGEEDFLLHQLIASYQYSTNPPHIGFPYDIQKATALQYGGQDEGQPPPPVPSEEDDGRPPTKRVFPLVSAECRLFVCHDERMAAWPIFREKMLRAGWSVLDLTFDQRENIEDFMSEEAWKGLDGAGYCEDPWDPPFEKLSKMGVVDPSKLQLPYDSQKTARKGDRRRKGDPDPG